MYENMVANGDMPRGPQQIEEPKESHDEHMAKVKAGLEQILNSENIDEIKRIAQSLLAEEEGEMAGKVSESVSGNAELEEGLDKILK